MSTLTREHIAEALALIKPGKTLDLSDAYLIRETMRMALASLEAEPAGYHIIIESGAVGCSVATLKEAEEMRDFWNKSWIIKPYFYSTYPAPVSVPDEATPENIEILASTFAPRGVTYQWDRDECNAAADSWNACRTAMLHGYVKK